MKKASMPVILFILIAACKISSTLTVTDDFSMSFSYPSLFLFPTNVYMEYAVINQIDESVPLYVTVQSLRLNCEVSNPQNFPVTLSLLVSTNYTALPGQTTFYLAGVYPYVSDSNQTVLLINNLTLPAHRSTNLGYTSTAANPVLIEALLYSEVYALIVQAEAPPFQTINLLMNVNATAEILTESQTADLPLLSGVIQ
ncbi:MAG: hypothetical protein A2Y33_10195 [Spirochaetes bacterium GWF1_51_8]|nr:MAG: hypothetical protein A2Y33_10195 [Spirochaetes bacterium GWF1_51_8]